MGVQVPVLASADALTIDLWFSRASLAALKAKEKKLLGDQDLTAVQHLRDYLQHQLDVAQLSGHLSSEAVPEDTLRTSLDFALAAFTQPVNSARLSPIVLNSLIERLNELERANLSEKEASRLIAELHDINRWERNLTDLPNIDDIHE